MYIKTIYLPTTRGSHNYDGCKCQRSSVTVTKLFPVCREHGEVCPGSGDKRLADLQPDEKYIYDMQYFICIDENAVYLQSNCRNFEF